MPIYYGGLSGLDRISGTTNGFISISDRGPNVDADKLNGGKGAGFFPLPKFNPCIYNLRLEADSIRVEKIIPLKTESGGMVSGLPLPAAPGMKKEIFFIDTNKTPAMTDKFGIDCEGIVAGKDNELIICEEYGPCVWSVDKKSGVLKKRYSPYQISGKEILFDSAYAKRRANRGFEGIAVTPSGQIMALLQSSANNPNSEAGENSRVQRLLEIDPKTGKSKTYVYLHEPKTENIREKDWKIGDMTTINENEFLVIEHAVRKGEDSKKVYIIDKSAATPITSDNFGGKTLEQLDDAAGLEASHIKPVQKKLFLDLLANGWDPKLEKPEGITIVNDSTIAVCNDNDFGITSTNADGVISNTGVPSRIYIFTLPSDQKIKRLKR
ncbi:MAG: esterase-like activity of phytase family protein [bacterium]